MSDRQGLARGWGRAIATLGLFLLWLPAVALATPLPGTIMGTVRLLSDESELANQTVRLSQGGQVIDTETTDVDGEYIFTPLSAGVYTVSVVPTEDYEAPIPRTVGLANGATEIVDFNLLEEGGEEPYILNWWIKDSTTPTSGKYINPDHGSEVAGDCNTFLIIPSDSPVAVARVSRMTVEPACGHGVYEVPGESFSNYTWNDGVVPYGTHAFNTWWISPTIHNGPATITIYYMSVVSVQDPEGGHMEEVEQSATLGIEVHNFVIEPLYDDAHPKQLLWDPSDPQGQAGRSKTGIRFALKSGAKTALPITRRIYPLHHNGRGGEILVDMKAAVTSGDWDEPTMISWDWDGKDGSGNPQPRGVYPYEAHTWEGEQPFLSGGGDCVKSVYLIAFGSVDPPDPDPRPAQWAEFLGYNGDDQTYEFAIDYGLQHFAPGKTEAVDAKVLLIGPEFQVITEFDIADLKCLNHKFLFIPLKDGCNAALPGQHHRLVVPVPAGNMAVGGSYAFVVTAKDGALVFDHEHRTKPMVEVGQIWDQLDLDIDSDNDNGYAAPDRSAAEDVIEDADDEPGKLVRPNTDDSDGDGIPDYADGFDWDQNTGNDDDQTADEYFVPLILEFPSTQAPDSTTVSIAYAASDPNGVQRSGGAPDFTYQPAAGHVRIWTKPGDAARDSRSILQGGDYLPPGTYTVEQLGGPLRTWYVEGVTTRSGWAHDRIEVSGHASSGFDSTDAVRLTVALVDLIVAELGEEGTPTPTERDPGAYVVLNDDDDDQDDESDGEQDGPVAGENDLIPARFEFGEDMPQGTVITFRAATGASRVRVFAQSDKGGTQVELPKSWTFGDDPLPEKVWIEGVELSASPRDVRLTLTARPPSLEYDLPDSAWATVYACDLDIDSDNTSLYSPPDRSLAEDGLEDIAGDDARPGKIMLVDDEDVDTDALPDFADGFGFINGVPAYERCDGLQFAPLVLDVPGLEPGTFTVSIDYFASSPIDLQAGWTEPYIVPLGTFRLWRVDGSVSRSKQSIKNGGDYVPPGEYTSQELGLVAGQPLTLYLEAISPSSSVADETIRVVIRPNGRQAHADQVRVTVVDAVLEGHGFNSSAWSEMDGIAASTLDPDWPTPDCAPLMNPNSTPGAYVIYRYRLRDPRTTGLTDITVNGHTLALTRQGADWLSEEFIAIQSGESGEGIQTEWFTVPSSEIDCEYNPLWTKASGWFWAKVPPDSVIHNLADRITENMHAEGWLPENPGYSGEFGVEVHRRVSLELNQESRWLCGEVYVDPATRRVFSTRGDGRVQVDAIYLKSGVNIVLDDPVQGILQAADIERLYEIKNSVSGIPDDEQLGRLRNVWTGSEPLTVSHPKFRFEGGQMVKSKRRIRLDKAAAKLGILTSVIFLVSEAASQEKLDAILVLMEDIATDDYGGDKDALQLRIATELIPAFTDYLGQMDFGTDYTDMLKLGLVYKVLFYDGGGPWFGYRPTGGSVPVSAWPSGPVRRRLGK